MDPMTEALLYAASRAQHVEEVIKPAVERGDIVICDRFVDSSIAYQGYGRGLGKAVSDINSYATAGCMPDVNVFNEGAAADKRGKDRKQREGQDRDGA